MGHSRGSPSRRSDIRSIRRGVASHFPCDTMSKNHELPSSSAPLPAAAAAPPFSCC
jgi:hypothetical protein